MYKELLDNGITRFKFVIYEDKVLPYKRCSIMSNMFTTDSDDVTGKAFAYDKYLYLYLPQEIDDVESAVSWVKEYKPYFYVIEPEPIELDLADDELGQFQSLPIYYPNMEITNNIDCVMTAQYIADTKLYIDNKFAELNAALANTQANLL